MTPPKRSVPRPIATVMASTMESVFRLLRRPTAPPLTRFLVGFMGSDRSYDISAARSDLGYAPLVSFEDGVQELRSHRKRAVSWGTSRRWTAAGQTRNVAACSAVRCRDAAMRSMVAPSMRERGPEATMLTRGWPAASHTATPTAAISVSPSPTATA